MDCYPVIPIPQVASYMCQPSPPQSTAVPPNIYPTLLPPAPPHELALRKMPPCTLISNPFPGNAVTVVHIPAQLLQVLQREPTKYNQDDMITTCSSCGQTNTLWELRMKKMAQELADDYALKCHLRREIRFEPLPGEEPPPPFVNNMSYQSADLCKMSNLRPNAHEFTPAQRNHKAGAGTQASSNNTLDECEYQQSAARLSVTESSPESGTQDSSVPDAGNQDAATIDSIPETYIQNDCIVSSHGGSSESVNRTDSSNSSKRRVKKNTSRNTRRDARSNEPEMKMDNNRNYKSSDDTNALKKDRTNESRYIHAIEQQANSRNSEYKKGSSMNGKPNGLPRSTYTKSRSYDRRSGDYMSGDSFVASSKWSKSSNGSIPKKPSRRTDMLMIHEIEGDLFTASADSALAHCVAEDFRMGAGIGVQFRKRFGHVGELLNQRKTVGEVAYLEHGGRFIFYLVTKKLSYSKPTPDTMARALRSLHRLCEELNVKKLAMPLIGCGLDKLRWEDVRELLCDEFYQSDIEIYVYHFKEEEANVDVSPASKLSAKLKVCEVQYPLIEIEPNTALVVYGAADGTIDKANEPLNTKYPYIEDFEKSFKNSPKEIFYPVFVHQQEYVCILIVRNSLSEPFDFSRLAHSIRKFNTFLKNNQYQYVGIERIADDADPLINDKIISVFRSTLITTVELYACSSPPKSYSSSTMSPSSAAKYNSFSNANSTASSN